MTISPKWEEIEGGFSTVYPIRSISSEKSKEKSKVKSKEKSKEKILDLLSSDPKLTIDGLMLATGLSQSGVEKNIRELKAGGELRRKGGDKGGEWEVVEMK